MDFTRQIIQLLSEPPGSFIFHLITLFALQVVFAISYARWRREPDDDYARNMSWAAAAIFAGRLILLLVGLYYSSRPESAAGILPPLEQALNTASIILVIWALIPAPDSHPRALDVMLIIGLILTGVIYLYFAQDWYAQAATGNVAFQGTTQASFWSMSQIALLAVALTYLLFRERDLGALPPIIVITLLIAHVVHLWKIPEAVPTDTNVAYWVRLGYLIALPLWAVYAYQYAMTPLLASQSRWQDAVEKCGVSLKRAAQVIASDQRQRRLAYSLEMANQTFNTSFAALGLVDDADAATIRFFSANAERGPTEVRTWSMDLGEQGALATALQQGRPIELRRDGIGSRQLFAFFEAAGIEPTRTLLVQPLSSNGNRIGLLVLPTPDNQEQWTEDALVVVPGLASFIAQAIVTAHVPAPVEEEEEIAPMPTSVVPAAIVMDRARLNDLEYQLTETREALVEAEQKRRHAEANAAAAQKQARYLATALRTLQSPAAGDTVDPPQESAPEEEEEERQENI